MVIMMTEIVYDTKINAYVVPNAGQTSVLTGKELECFKDMNVKDRVFMDIGACAGLVSKLALERGAKQVICVEPFPTNIEVIKKNVPDAIIVPKAVVPKSGPSEIEFYSAVSGNLGIGGVIPPKPGKKHLRNSPIIVPTIEFNELLLLYKPDVIKMDIEGSEFDIFNGPLPDYVQEFHCEFHIFYRDDRILKWWKQFCYEWFCSIYWEVIVPPVWPKTDRIVKSFSGMNVTRMAWRRKDPTKIRHSKRRKNDH